MKAEEIKKVHCFFEQSGTFKNEFIKLGISAEDYDIQNNFGQTDHVIDLFKEIETEYTNLTTSQPHNLTTSQPHNLTIFSSIDAEHDLVLAFFPCIYFETMSQIDFALMRNGTLNKSLTKRIEYALDRLEKRTQFHKLIYKFVAICDQKKIRMILENPASKPNYLISGQNFLPPTFIDKNRMERGDVFKKPTAYWFINCEPTHGFSYQNDKKQKVINDCARSKGNGLCSEERSMISPDYARNFICDFILGKQQDCIQQKEFDFFS